MTSRLKIDLTGLTHVAVASGPSSTDLESLGGGLRDAHASILARRESGEIGFFDLPVEGRHHQATRDVASNLGKCDRVVVLGMGGSSLGGQMLSAALGPGDGASLAFVDNSDPRSLARIIASSAPDRTVWNAITKSGGTSETCAQLLAVSEALEKSIGRDEARKRIVITTDPERGNLRALAGELGLATLEVPPNVGGRFSVLSAVGLFPAHLAGFDVPALLAGAAHMRERVLDASDPLRNPALLLAQLVVWHLERGRPIHVVWAYADGLERFGAWFQQLWAESLGKRDRSGNAVGPTPLLARGATDQHSMLQLFADGPDDKVHLFLNPRRRPPLALSGETLFGAGAGFDYLAGRDLGELIAAQMDGTRSSLSARGRPTALLEVESVDAFAIGELVMLMEAATAFAGPLLGVDPFDQPGVEEAKVLAFASLGREGYADRARDPVASDPAYVV